MSGGIFGNEGGFTDWTVKTVGDAVINSSEAFGYTVPEWQGFNSFYNKYNVMLKKENEGLQADIEKNNQSVLQNIFVIGGVALLVGLLLGRK